MSALTTESFLAFYPRFSFFSRGVVLPEYIRQANARFGDFGEDTEEARRLFTAHQLTLYAAGMPSGDAEPAPDNVAEVIVAKQRNGPLGVVKLAWLGEFTLFDNLSEL